MSSAVAPCPECGHKISLKKPRLGQMVTCRQCDAELEVIEIKPLELDLAYTDDSYEEEEYEYEDGGESW